MIGIPISGPVTWVACRHMHNADGFYMIEHRGYNWILPTALLTPTDLRALADDMEKRENET